MLTQDVQLMMEDLVTHACKEIATIGVLGNKSERFALTAAADQDRRMGFLNDLRRIEQSGEVIIFAIIGLFITCPHLQCYLERLF